MRLSAIKIYVSGILGCSILAIALLDWTTLAQFSLNALMGAMVLTLLGIISESLAISVRVGDSSGTSSVTFIPLLTCVLLFGPPAAVVLVGISGVVGEFLIRKKEPIRGIFNISQWLLGVAAGGAVYTMLGGTALALLPEGHVGSIGTQIVPFAIFGAIFVLMNHTATALAIAIDQRLSFRWVFASIMGRSGSNLLNDILVLCSQSLFRFADLGDDGLCRGDPDKGCGVIVAAIGVVVDRSPTPTVPRQSRERCWPFRPRVAVWSVCSPIAPSACVLLGAT